MQNQFQFRLDCEKLVNFTFCKATWCPGPVQMWTKIWRKHRAIVRNLRQRQGLPETNWSMRKMSNPALLQCYRWPSQEIQCFGMLAASSPRPIEWIDSQHPLDRGIHTHRPKAYRRPQIDCNRPFRSRPVSTDSYRSPNSRQRRRTSMNRTCLHQTFPFDWTPSMASDRMDAAAMVALLSAAQESVPPMSERFPFAAMARTPLARLSTHFGNSRTNSFFLTSWAKLTHSRTPVIQTAISDSIARKIQCWTLLNSDSRMDLHKMNDFCFSSLIAYVNFSSTQNTRSNFTRTLLTNTLELTDFNFKNYQTFQYFLLFLIDHFVNSSPFVFEIWFSFSVQQ